MRDVVEEGEEEKRDREWRRRMTKIMKRIMMMTIVKSW
jgi:hypothetical protein